MLREPARRRAPYVETDALGGYDPYSSSKACAELVTRPTAAASSARAAAPQARVGTGRQRHRRRRLGRGPPPARLRARALTAGAAGRGPQPRRGAALAARAGVRSRAISGLPRALWAAPSRGCRRQRRRRGTSARAPTPRSPFARSSSSSWREWGDGEWASAPGAGQPHEAGLLVLDCRQGRDGSSAGRRRGAWTQAVAAAARWYRGVLRRRRARRAARSCRDGHRRATRRPRMMRAHRCAVDGGLAVSGSAGATELRGQIRGLVARVLRGHLGRRAMPSCPGETPGALRRPCVRRRGARACSWTPRWTSGSRTAATRSASSASSATYLGVRHCLLVNSGSSANLLAFMALTSEQLGERRVRRGDEVITVAAGFPTTVAPIVQYGAVPVFVDVRADTANVDVGASRGGRRSAHARRSSSRTRSATPSTSMPCASFCERHGLWLIEDNCDALGSRYRGRLTGGFGHVATSSFYPPHHMTMGEGGAVYTDDARAGRDHRRRCATGAATASAAAARTTAAAGASAGSSGAAVRLRPQVRVLRVRLQPQGDRDAGGRGLRAAAKLPEFTRLRREHHATLSRLLAPVVAPSAPQEATPGSEPSWFGLLLTLTDGGEGRGSDPRRHRRGSSRRPRSRRACSSPATWCDSPASTACGPPLGRAALAAGYRVAGDLAVDRPHHETTRSGSACTPD